MDIQVYLSANQTLQYWVTHHEKNDNYLLEHCSRGGIRAILIAVLSPKHQSNMNVLSCYFLTKDNITKVLFALKKCVKSKLICQLLQRLMFSSQNLPVTSKEVSDRHTEELLPSHQARPKPLTSKIIQQLPLLLLILNRPSQKQLLVFKSHVRYRNSDAKDWDTTSEYLFSPRFGREIYLL